MPAGVTMAEVDVPGDGLEMASCPSLSILVAKSAVFQLDTTQSQDNSSQAAAQQPAAVPNHHRGSLPKHAGESELALTANRKVRVPEECLNLW